MTIYGPYRLVNPFKVFEEFENNNNNTSATKANKAADNDKNEDDKEPNTIALFQKFHDLTVYDYANYDGDIINEFDKQLPKYLPMFTNLTSFTIDNCFNAERLKDYMPRIIASLPAAQMESLTICLAKPEIKRQMHMISHKFTKLKSLSLSISGDSSYYSSDVKGITLTESENVEKSSSLISPTEEEAVFNLDMMKTVSKLSITNCYITNTAQMVSRMKECTFLNLDKLENETQVMDLFVALTNHHRRSLNNLTIKAASTKAQMMQKLSLCNWFIEFPKLTQIKLDELVFTSYDMKATGANFAQIPSIAIAQMQQVKQQKIPLERIEMAPAYFKPHETYFTEFLPTYASTVKSITDQASYNRGFIRPSCSVPLEQAFVSKFPDLNFPVFKLLTAARLSTLFFTVADARFFMSLLPALTDVEFKFAIPEAKDFNKLVPLVWAFSGLKGRKFTRISVACHPVEKQYLPIETFKVPDTPLTRSDLPEAASLDISAVETSSNQVVEAAAETMGLMPGINSVYLTFANCLATVYKHIDGSQLKRAHLSAYNQSVDTSQLEAMFKCITTTSPAQQQIQASQDKVTACSMESVYISAIVSDAQDKLTVIVPYLKYLGNLKTFTIQDSHAYYHYGNTPQIALTSAFYTELFNSCPLLERIDFRLRIDDVNLYFKTLANAPCTPNLTEFDISVKDVDVTSYFESLVAFLGKAKRLMRFGMQELPVEYHSKLLDNIICLSYDSQTYPMIDLRIQSENIQDMRKQYPQLSLAS